MKCLKVNLGERSYEIMIEQGLRHQYSEWIKPIFKGKRIAIITDLNVNALYGDDLEKQLVDAGYSTQRLLIEPGEKSKSFETLPFLYEALVKMKFSRSDLIIALGGGVVGDLAGFVASTYLRGVDFVQIPTSLLAQVDSSVGGKVGVDLPSGKNLVGSFYQPKRVLIDPEVLNTLEPKFFNDGMGEVIKYACIKDAALYKQLMAFEDQEALKANMDDIIYTCCDLKRQVVEGDEKDTGERMVLNFGHTLGHAIEKVFGYETYTHGEGVGIGMYEITKRSEYLGLTEQGTSEAIRVLLQKYHLPYEVNLDNKEEVLETIGIDKKNLNNNLNIILLKKMGECFIYPTDLTFFAD